MINIVATNDLIVFEKLTEANHKIKANIGRIISRSLTIPVPAITVGEVK
jgi:hypothetical protein